MVYVGLINIENFLAVLYLKRSENFWNRLETSKRFLIYAFSKLRVIDYSNHRTRRATVFCMGSIANRPLKKESRIKTTLKKNTTVSALPSFLSNRKLLPSIDLHSQNDNWGANYYCYVLRFYDRYFYVCKMIRRQPLRASL